MSTILPDTTTESKIYRKCKEKSDKISQDLMIHVDQTICIHSGFI